MLRPLNTSVDLAQRSLDPQEYYSHVICMLHLDFLGSKSNLEATQKRGKQTETVHIAISQLMEKNREAFMAPNFSVEMDSTVTVQVAVSAL